MRTPPFTVPEGLTVKHLFVNEPEQPGWDIQFPTDHDLRFSVFPWDGEYCVSSTCIEFACTIETNEMVAEEDLDDVIFGVIQRFVTRCPVS